MADTKPDEPATPDPPVTRAPGAKPRWGYDADGNEIQPPATGVLIDAETGRTVIPRGGGPVVGDSRDEEPTPAPKPTASKSSASSS